MDLLMANDAECYEIFFGIVTQQAARSDVVDVETCPSTAMLTTPAVSLQNDVVKLRI